MEACPPAATISAFDVLDLAIDRVRRRVSAVASAPAVVGDHGEARCELSGQLPPRPNDRPTRRRR